MTLRIILISFSLYATSPEVHVTAANSIVNKLMSEQLVLKWLFTCEPTYPSSEDSTENSSKNYG